jgi:hypothetical protein
VEKHRLTLHRRYFLKELHCLTLHHRYFFKVALPTSGLDSLVYLAPAGFL